MKNIVSNFSGGITSAVATKEALKDFPDMKIIFIETGSHHPDMQRFLNDCSEWFGKEIIILKSAYTNLFDVIRRVRFINSSHSAACTTRLKIDVRKKFEYENQVDGYVWGFEYQEPKKNKKTGEIKTPKEIKRAENIKERYPDFQHIFPLIDKKITKRNALCLLEKAGIKKPKMYELGYQNNNCIGCVKGGMGYWNKIRVDFPEIFNEMSELEQEIGYSCLNSFNGYETEPLFLKDLHPERGDFKKEIMPECSVLCTQLRMAV